MKYNKKYRTPKNTKVKNKIALVAAGAFFMSAPFSVQANTWQSPQPTNQSFHHGLNSHQGHFGPTTANDFHTPMWHRFQNPNYQFSSGPNYRYTLGRPTYAFGFSRTPSTQNMRVDVQGSFLPPNNRFMSGVFPVDQANPFVSLPQQNAPTETHSPHAMTPWDSTGQGANHHHQHGNNFSVQQGQGGILPNTSILGQ